MIVLDTNVVSALMRDAVDEDVLAWLDQQPSPSVWTTAISVYEIRFGVERLPSGRRRDALAHAFARVMADDLAGRVLTLGEVEAAEAAFLAARRRKSGRTGSTNDTMIAGIVKARKATLATGNIRHFEDADIDLVDPWNR